MLQQHLVVNLNFPFIKFTSLCPRGNPLDSNFEPPRRRDLFAHFPSRFIFLLEKSLNVSGNSLKKVDDANFPLFFPSRFHPRAIFSARGRKRVAASCVIFRLIWKLNVTVINDFVSRFAFHPGRPCRFAPFKRGA